MQRSECLRTLAIKPAGRGWEGREGRGRGDPEHLVLHPVLARGIFLVLMTLMHLVLHLVLASGFLIPGGNERGNDRLWATRKRENIARTGARPKHLVLHRVLARGILEIPRNKRRGGPEGATRERVQKQGGAQSPFF